VEAADVENVGRVKPVEWQATDVRAEETDPLAHRNRLSETARLSGEKRRGGDLGAKCV
jgi:hypothetical protein